MDALRAMFPDAADAALSHALATSNGDVSAAVEQLLPASEQVRSDAELARALQMADAGRAPAGAGPAGGAGGGGADAPGFAEVARPVLDGIAAAGAAARAAVEYVASEIAAAATGAPQSPQQPAGRARRADPDDDASVVAGGGARAAAASGVTLRSNRGSARTEPRSAFGGKED